jgi:hypothetical protein
MAQNDPLFFDPNCSLTVEEKIAKMATEKERRDAAAWTILPRLFEVWGKCTANENVLGS